MKVLLCCPYCGAIDLIGTDSEYVYRCKCKDVDISVDDLGIKSYRTSLSRQATILESLNIELNRRNMFGKHIQRLSIDADTEHGVAVLDESKGSAGILVWDSVQGRWI